MPEPLEPSDSFESVWLTGQTSYRAQRGGRYLPESTAHPGKMLPAIAAHAIATYTRPGDLVADPMCGIGTTLVEAVHAGRDAIGVEVEARWAGLARDNLAYAASQGATGSGRVWCTDARDLPAPLPAAFHGTVSLVLTSPPYGPSSHGQVRAPGPRRGPVGKFDHRYAPSRAGRRNLAHRTPEVLAEGFSQILTGVAPLLRPGGYLVITTRPYRRYGELVDVAGMAIAAAERAGFGLVDRCVALIAGIRDRRLVPRASFFQLTNLRAAIERGDPQWLVAHEDLLVFQP